jgi:hypothetical protein
MQVVVRLAYNQPYSFPTDITLGNPKYQASTDIFSVHAHANAEWGSYAAFLVKLAITIVCSDSTDSWEIDGFRRAVGGTELKVVAIGYLEKTCRIPGQC